MNDWFLLAVAILAAFRLAQFAVYEEGPKRFMQTLRERAGVYDYGENREPTSSLGRLLSCPYCVGMWLAAALAAGLFWQRPLWVPMMWLAVAGGQAFLQGLVERR